MFSYGLESPVHVRIIEFTVVLILNDIAELVVSDDFIKLSFRSNFNQETDLLVISSVIIPDLSRYRCTMLAAIRHITNESEAKEFIRTEMG
jgi:hypothetical protein